MTVGITEAQMKTYQDLMMKIFTITTARPLVSFDIESKPSGQTKLTVNWHAASYDEMKPDE